MAQLTLSDRYLFFRNFIESPLRIASPFPSGRRLSAAIASLVDLRTRDPILELGAGTGAVTKALLARGLPEQRLIAIESDPVFAGRLRAKFPRLRILKGDAFVFDEVVRRAGYEGPFGAIVSGLPILSQPAEKRAALLARALANMKPGSSFIQFSYGARAPIMPWGRITARCAARVWQSFPPMHIWVYRSHVAEVFQPVPAASLE
jgi:phosphatidylethanolamine/phosphatidyl-N-methylethanolamine N-methyltransferase